MWCYFVKPGIMLKKLLYSIILIASDKLSFHEKIEYWIKASISLGFFGWVLNGIGLWFSENKQFWVGMIVAITANMYYGYKVHKKDKDFSWKIFWKKNREMWLIIITTYPLLEALYSVAGENAIAEGFKILVQVSTLLYPGSKALKNAYLYSDKKYPPGFIMERIYDFEKNGDVRKFFAEPDKKENDNDNNKL